MLVSIIAFGVLLGVFLMGYVVGFRSALQFAADELQVQRDRLRAEAERRGVHFD
jgi:hypothetical protein